MQRQKGFTLIELIIVIIILGILAALAMPRLINFKSDARLAVVHSTVSTIESMNVMMYGKTTLMGADTGTTKVDIDKLKDVDVTEGYLSATPENLINVLNLNATTEDKPDALAGHEWLIQAVTVDVGNPKAIQIRQITSPPACSFIYTEATKETYPTYTKIPTLKDC